MKIFNGINALSTVSTRIKTEVQRAWYGVTREYFLENDDLPRPESVDDERKGYKFDEVADVRSLLDQYMTITAADKSLNSVKAHQVKDEWNKVDVPGSSDIMMFFRSRSLDSSVNQEQAVQGETHEHVGNRFAHSRHQAAAFHRGRSMHHQLEQQQQQQQAQQQSQTRPGQGKKDQSNQEDFRAQITGKSTGKSLLQELAAKLKKQEAEQVEQNLNSQTRYAKPRKYYDSADYP